MIFQYCQLPNCGGLLYSKRRIMCKQLLLTLMVLVIFSPGYAQPPTQTLSGSIFDEVSMVPLSYASISILGTAPIVGTVSDLEGRFSFIDLPIGRYDLEVSYLGYESKIIREILIQSGKESTLEIGLKEDVLSMNEVVIQAGDHKSEPINSMGLVSARMFGVEEAQRFAGGLDDPARLASSFAGVTSEIGNNGIVIRGNASQALLWQMEGIEIRNPNHFADLSIFGGGGITALSAQVMTHSDFFTGAFPAEYGNAMSGVFDLKLRKGNTNSRETTVQMGLLGIDFASEGPIIRDRNESSYLFNYRYSTLSLLESILPENAGGTTYQDLSFKLFFPTRRAGTFSLWGIGLIDHSDQEAENHLTQVEFASDLENQVIDQYMGASGLKHIMQLGKKSILSSQLAFTTDGIDFLSSEYRQDRREFFKSSVANQHMSIHVKTSFHKKFNSRFDFKTGINFRKMFYDLDIKGRDQNSYKSQPLVNATGSADLWSMFGTASVRVSKTLEGVFGLYSQQFNLNRKRVVEPRLAIKKRFKDFSLGMAYGNHSRLEKLPYYFTLKNGTHINKKMDFGKAHHLVLSFQKRIGRHSRMIIEPYYQRLFDIPVIPDSSFSIINAESDWLFNHTLVNRGKGRNLGIDFTIERFLHQGYYYLFTGSLFKSRYLGGDSIWRSTRFDRNFVLNALLGKEWQMGKFQQNLFSVNLKTTWQGGEKITPVNLALSHLNKDITYDGQYAYSDCLQPSLMLHFSISLRLNRKRHASTWVFNLINATGVTEFNGFKYNLLNHTIEKDQEVLFVPNLAYKIEF